MWEVTAELPGFQRVTQTGITLELGRILQLEFTLSIGPISEAVTVEVSAPLLQATTAEISDVIETREVEQMPLNSRQFLQLAQLSDAVVIPPGGTRGGALQQAGPLPNVGGQRAGHNIYMLDGFKVTDELFNNLVINPSIDSIQEIKIQKSMYPPEFGGKASALINVATKAGSNRVHGSLFEFIRDDRFDAHNFFDDRRAPVPPLEQTSVRRVARRPPCEGSHLLLRQLRAATHTPVDHQDLFGAGRRVARRRFLRIRDRSATRAPSTPRPALARRSPTTRSPPTGSTRSRRRFSPTSRSRTARAGSRT